MFVLSNFVIALAKLTDIILTFLYWIILIRAVISWVSPDPFNPIVQFLHRFTEPILEPIRRVIPSLGGLDISPIIAFLGIMFLKSFLVASIFDLGLRLR